MKRLLYTLLFLFFISGLQAQVLVPDFFDPKTGKDKVHFIESDGIQVFLENLKANDHLLVFDLEIGNRTLHSINLEESDIYLLGSQSPFPTGDWQEVKEYEAGLSRYDALQEKQVVAAYHEELRKLRHQRIALGVLTVGLMAFDIAMDVRDMNRQEWTPGHQYNADIRKLATFIGYTATDVARGKAGIAMYESGEDLHYLRQELFLFDVIQPRENQRGKVFFPMKQARYYRIVVDIEGHEYVMDFRWAENRDLRRLRKAAAGK